MHNVRLFFYVLAAESFDVFYFVHILLKLCVFCAMSRVLRRHFNLFLLLVITCLGTTDKILAYLHWRVCENVDWQALSKSNQIKKERNITCHVNKMFFFLFFSELYYKRNQPSDSVWDVGYIKHVFHGQQQNLTPGDSRNWPWRQDLKTLVKAFNKCFTKAKNFQHHTQESQQTCFRFITQSRDIQPIRSCCGQAFRWDGAEADLNSCYKHFVIKKEKWKQIISQKLALWSAERNPSLMK